MRTRPTTSNPLRRAVAAVCVAVTAVASTAWPQGAIAAEQWVPGAVLAPHYGDTLFEFFQNRYFSAITGLMTSQSFERLSPHGDESEVLRGGLLLSYGMHRDAGEIFAQLIEKGAPLSVRDRAWYYLAKIRYQRGLPADAEASLARIQGKLPGELEDDRQLLHANLLLERGDNTGAATVLRASTARIGAGNYARYNLGVALLRDGDSAGGGQWLDELGRAPAAKDEARGLRDRANVALGYAALKDGRAGDARTYLERVRLQGLHSSKALLGFGWAAAAQKEPRLALVPWTELASRDVSDAAVLEARIALPYAYAELGALGQSLSRYEAAIASFERENANLDESIAAIRAGKLIDGLIESNPGDEMGWFWNISDLPQIPHASHLTQMLARHDFQEAFKNYRDLQFLAANLAQWQDKLGVFSDMLTTRRQAYVERLPQIRARAADTDLPAMTQRSAQLATELNAAEQLGNGTAFADARQLDLQARLARVQASLDAAPGDPELAEVRERQRRAAGALNWELAQTYAQRRRDAVKALQATEAQIDEARRREAALAQAQRDEPARFDAFADRVAALGPRLDVMLPRVVALSREQQNVVQELAVAELTRQKARLIDYTMQARFAVAQLYDGAAVSQGKSDATEP
jgi:hypothetical protein